jgi:hypothetical protein
LKLFYLFFIRKNLNQIKKKRGRFALRSNKIQYKIINKLSEWFDLITDDRISVISADFTNDKFLQVHYKNTHLNTRASKTNIVLAAFVTSHARLELLAELRKFCPTQIIYYDTGTIYTNIKTEFDWIHIKAI